MVEQSSLFDAPPDPGKDQLGPFQRHSETSRRAAIDNYPRSGTQRHRVYQAIVAAGEDGYTREELSVTLRLPLNSVLPRVAELKAAGLVIESGRQRTTSTGSRAAVLVDVEGSP